MTEESLKIKVIEDSFETIISELERVFIKKGYDRKFIISIACGWFTGSICTYAKQYDLTDERLEEIVNDLTNEIKSTVREFCEERRQTKKKPTSPQESSE